MLTKFKFKKQNFPSGKDSSENVNYFIQYANSLPPRVLGTVDIISREAEGIVINCNFNNL